MTVRAALLALASMAAFAQQFTSHAVVGTIEWLSSNEIRVSAGAQSVTFHVDSGIQVWKDGTYKGLPVLRIGDEISVRGVKGASGELRARSVSAQKITFRAVVRKVDRSNFTILTAARTDSVLTSEAHSKTVNYFPNTVFSTSANDLAVGQEILVVGLELQDGAVDATRIALYNTDLPVNR